MWKNPQGIIAEGARQSEDVISGEINLDVLYENRLGGSNNVQDRRRKQAYIISGHHTLNNRMCPFYVLAEVVMGYLKLPEGKKDCGQSWCRVDAQSLYGWADLIDHRHPLCHEESLVHKLAYAGF